LGEGLGDGLGDGLGVASGVGVAVGEPLGLGLGIGIGLCVGTGVSVGVGGGGGGAGEVLGDGTVVVLALGVDLEVPFRVFLPLGVAGAMTSAGDGPASAGLETSAPTAAGAAGSDFGVLLLLVARPGVNEQGWAGSAGDNVSRSPDFRPRKETTVGVAVVASPICRATAV
jgi:hypothetical protein